MKKIVMLALMFVGIAPVGFAQGKDLSGRWTAPFNREGTPVTLVLNLKADGEQITGTMIDARGTKMTIENGKLEDNKLTFDTNAEGPGGRKFHFHFTGNVNDDDTIALKMEFNAQSGGPALTFHRSDN